MEIEWKNEIHYQDLVKWNTRLKYEAPFFNEIIQGIAKPKIRILDVSCGTGDHLVMFAKWGYEAVGIDISEHNIAAAEELSKRNKTESKIKFIVGDMLKLEESLEGERFDFISCIGNTFSIFSPEERTIIINQMYNLLNVGGKILFQVVNYLSHTSETEWFYKPNLLRGTRDEIQYIVRIMEWKEMKEKITMYVLKAQQTSKESDDFILQKKRTEFHVLKNNHFKEFTDKVRGELTIFGNYEKSEFNEEISKDLVILITKT
ncbi:MAG: class I SAM-dependent methyltransferase [Candidatus Heimdallarchaeota archaeon]|nr:class I SAM-dependent methyltransferase [Candidatus Heimdallarchaeota archaeon]